MKNSITFLFIFLLILTLHAQENLNINKTDGSSISIPINEIEKISFRSSDTNFVFVQGGTFLMGARNHDSQWAYTDEYPQHSVQLNSFYMCKYEVTQGEYQTVVGYNPAQNYGVGDNLPVYYVRWTDTIEFCNRLSIMKGLTPCYSVNNDTNPDNWGSFQHNDVQCDWNANGFRLPTEAEWEYAARSGEIDDDFLYSGSNNIDEIAWYGDFYGEAHPVGSKMPNSLGIYDMSGNVYERLWDRYGYGDYYQYCSNQGTVTNPTGPQTGEERVKRGGSWYYYDHYCRVADRGNSIPYGSYIDQGFRIVRNAED